MKEENPELKVTEISKVLGEKWGKMDAEAKGPYNELAQTDKERCVALASFQSNTGIIRRRAMVNESPAFKS